MNNSNSYITNELFDAFIYCKYKSYLILNNIKGKESDYIKLFLELNKEYHFKVKHNLEISKDKIDVKSNQSIQELNKQIDQDFLFDIFITKDDCQSRIDAVEKVSEKSESDSDSFIYEPIIFNIESKDNKKSRLSLAYRAYVLDNFQDRIPDYGTIIFGSDLRRSRVRLTPYFMDVSKIISSLQDYINHKSKPSLILNRHCEICQFKELCRDEALAKDHLSLLRGISETEIIRHNSKGIFTVTQLSYTFRSRKKPKRAKEFSPTLSYPLKALALRENKIYIHENPQLPKERVYIYFDIESLPTRDFYYLIGLLIEENGVQQYHSFWADSKEQQQEICIKFLKQLQLYENYLLFHFGNYDSLALKRMRNQLPDEYRIPFDDIQNRMVNLLSIIHPHIYFPTWSNSLKEIASFLGFKWNDSKASGLQSIVWRENWERTSNSDIKEKIIQYNQDDCLALMQVTNFVKSVLSQEKCHSYSNNLEKEIIQTTEFKNHIETKKDHIFRKKEFILSELNIVNKCAYFDYQRDKVYIRSDKNFKQIKRRSQKRNNSLCKPNKIIEICVDRCKICQSKKISNHKELRRRLSDLKFFKGGVKKWITEYISWQYKCKKCNAKFIPDNLPDHRNKHGYGLMSWCVYHNVFLGQNMLKILRGLDDVFDLKISQPTIYRFKSYVANHLSELSEKTLKNVINSEILHIDETEINLRDKKGYVWVFANMDSVYYMYRESRESEFLKDLLKDFKGVLISDFFTGYDSLKCRQQKCLIHLIRDMDDDLRSNPYDEEFKNFIQKFASILHEAVKTIDKYGLKKRNLNKHKILVEKFMNYTKTTNFSSEISKKYQKRINKYDEKLFTFLDYNNVPWNNNNAEHAIKSFAKYRRFADGRPTEASIREFLILLSVLETCEYRNIDILEFLLSKKTDFL